MLHQVVMRSNGAVQEVLVDGERVAIDHGINVSELLYRLSRRLGFSYISEDGDWNDQNEWVPKKRR